MLMRRYHRWVSFPLIIFLIIVTGTGIYLQAVEMLAHDSGSADRVLERSAPQSTDVASAVEQGIETALATQPDFPIQKVEISYRGESPQVVVATNQRIGPSVTVNMETGDATYVERPPRTVRTIFVLLHSGKYYGMTGLVVIMLAGLILMVLSFTGLWVYIDMYRRRAKANKKGFFWK